jgi:hypothetical protein
VFYETETEFTVIISMNVIFKSVACAYDTEFFFHSIGVGKVHEGEWIL